MTDKEIIIDNFVDRYYTVDKLKLNGDIKVSIIKNKDGTFEYVTPFSFYRYVTNLYSNFITDENITVWKMVEEWYDSKNEKSYGEVIKYLDDNVSVSLGPTNWVVMVNNKEWSCKHLIAVFNRHDKQSIKLIYHDWYGNKVKELSEEMLNKSYY